MNPDRVWRFELGGWTIGCLAVSEKDAQSYIKRMYGGRARYAGPWTGAAGMGCGHITPAREAEIKFAMENKQ